MKTRKMTTEALHKLIDDLTSQLEIQHLRIVNLEDTRAFLRCPRQVRRQQLELMHRVFVPYRGDNKDKKSLSIWINSVERKLEFTRNLLPDVVDIDYVFMGGHNQRQNRRRVQRRISLKKQSRNMERNQTTISGLFC